MKKLALLVSMVLASNVVMAQVEKKDYIENEVTNFNKFNGLVDSKNYEILNIADFTEESDMFSSYKVAVVEHKSKDEMFQLFTYETVDCVSKTRLITQYATFSKLEDKFYMYGNMFKPTKTSKNLDLEEQVVKQMCGNNLYEAL